MSGEIQDQTVGRIIVRMPNWLGDVVMATPVLADIKCAFPNALLTAMADKKVAPLLEKDPNIDTLVSFQRPSGWLDYKSHCKIIQKVQEANCDTAILTTNSFSSSWWFYRANIAKRVGFSRRWRSWHLSHALPSPEDLQTQHQVITYKHLLKPLGISPSARAPQLYVSDEERTSAKTLLSAHGVTEEHILVGINPGAAYGSAKCWLPSRFQQVTEQLLQEPRIRIVYFADRAGQPLVDQICRAMPKKVINLAAKTSIRELIALIEQCSVFLTNDSGPMHIASAVQTPLVALFGSTSAVRTGPYGGGTVIHKHVSCSPCYKRECPIDFRCMKRIEVDEVVASILQNLH